MNRLPHPYIYALREPFTNSVAAANAHLDTQTDARREAHMTFGLSCHAVVSVGIRVIYR